MTQKYFTKLELAVIGLFNTGALEHLLHVSTIEGNSIRDDVQQVIDNIPSEFNPIYAVKLRYDDPGEGDYLLVADGYVAEAEDSEPAKFKTINGCYDLINLSEAIESEDDSSYVIVSYENGEWIDVEAIPSAGKVSKERQKAVHNTFVSTLDHTFPVTIRYGMEMPDPVTIRFGTTASEKE